MLWQWEFFGVYEKVDGLASQHRIYQALEFREATSDSVPFSVQTKLTATDRNGFVVKAMAFLPGEAVILANGLPRNRHTYDTDTSAEDADTLLRDNCKELVMVTDCIAWFPMSGVTTAKPRVLHPQMVKTRSVYVAGKDQHWLCGTKVKQKWAILT